MLPDEITYMLILVVYLTNIHLPKYDVSIV
jgi:hypothetical protein